MSIASEITRLQQAKASIKESIENKGVEVSDDAKLDEYPEIIDTIPQGGGEEIPQGVKYYDFDGTVLYEYTPEQFLALNEHPQLPTREGVINEGWNWPFDKAQKFVQAHGYLLIGCTYYVDSSNDAVSRFELNSPDTEYLIIDLSQATDIIINGVTQQLNAGENTITFQPGSNWFELEIFGITAYKKIPKNIKNAFLYKRNINLSAYHCSLLCMTENVSVPKNNITANEPLGRYTYRKCAIFGGTASTSYLHADIIIYPYLEYQISVGYLTTRNKDRQGICANILKVNSSYSNQFKDLFVFSNSYMCSQLYEKDFKCANIFSSTDASVAIYDFDNVPDNIDLLSRGVSIFDVKNLKVFKLIKENCTSLTFSQNQTPINILDLSIFKNLQYINFQSLSTLNHVIFPETLVEITYFTGENMHCKNITIPKSVSRIYNLFKQDYTPKEITILNPTPPTMSNSFNANIKGLIKIYVPAESVENYKAATNWSQYADRIEAIPE